MTSRQSPPAGEIWGFPKRWGEPRLFVEKDTLTGTLEYAGQTVALGTMNYKHHNRMKVEPAERGKLLKTQVNLELIPGVQRVAELVAYNLAEVTMKFNYAGPACLHLVPHVNAPVADLPVRHVIEGQHLKADLTLPYGRVLHDYVADR